MPLQTNKVNLTSLLGEVSRLARVRRANMPGDRLTEYSDRV